MFDIILLPLKLLFEFVIAGFLIIFWLFVIATIFSAIHKVLKQGINSIVRDAVDDCRKGT